MTQLTFSIYNKEYAKDFKQLNLEWIEKYFVVEEHDLEQLSNPKENIIDKNGDTTTFNVHFKFASCIGKGYEETPKPETSPRFSLREFVHDDQIQCMKKR